MCSEDSLLKKLTKINRMDIVHLIKTQLNKSVQEQMSRTYAEIEKTLDHSEGSVQHTHIHTHIRTHIHRAVEECQDQALCVSLYSLSMYQNLT